MSRIINCLILWITYLHCFSQPILQHRILHYPFNSGTSDVSVSGSDGSPDGASVLQDSSCHISGYLNTDGIDDHLLIGTLPQLNGNLNSFTVAFSMKTDSNVSEWATIIKSINDPVNGMVLAVETHREGTAFKKNSLLFYLRDEYGNRLGVDFNKPELYDNSWHNVAYVINDAGANDIDVYVDGQLQVINFGFAESPYLFVPFTYAFSLGAGNNRGTVEGFYKGGLDEFSIFDRSLSSDELDNLYNVGEKIFSLPFNGSSLDATSLENDGQVNNVTYSADGVISGDSSAVFDGNGYISLGELPQINSFSNSFSLNFWIRPDTTNITGVQTIFSSGSSSFCSEIKMELHADASGFNKGKLRCFLRDQNGNVLDVNVDIIDKLDDKWHSITMVMENANMNSVKMFIDNSAVPVLIESSSSPNINYPFNGAFSIGAEIVDSSILNFYHGKIDQMELFTCALDSIDIAVLNVHQVPTYLSNISYSNINIYPNPVNDVLYLSSDRDVKFNVQVMDLFGKVIYSNTCTSEVKAMDFPPGVYFITGKSKSEIFKNKFVKI